MSANTMAAFMAGDPTAFDRDVVTRDMCILAGWQALLRTLKVRARRAGGRGLGVHELACCDDCSVPCTQPTPPRPTDLTQEAGEACVAEFGTAYAQCEARLKEAAALREEGLQALLSAERNFFATVVLGRQARPRAPPCRAICVPRQA
jgi:hypothetical protein